MKSVKGKLTPASISSAAHGEARADHHLDGRGLDPLGRVGGRVLIDVFRPIEEQPGPVLTHGHSDMRRYIQR